MKVTVKARGSFGGELKVELGVRAITYEQFKEQFPKHFGNVVRYSSNRCQKQKQLVKDIIKTSNSFSDMKKRLSDVTLWCIEVEDRFYY